MAVNIRIEEGARNKIAEALSVLLADNFLLAVQTQDFHWNVEGEHFAAYHKLFEEQYTALFEANDEIAERIRALGDKAPGTMKDFLHLTSLHETSGNLNAKEMISTLLTGHEAILESTKLLMSLAHDAGDEATVDLVIGQQRFYQKTAWMLRSLLVK